MRDGRAGLGHPPWQGGGGGDGQRCVWDLNALKLDSLGEFWVPFKRKPPENATTSKALYRGFYRGVLWGLLRGILGVLGSLNPKPETPKTLSPKRMQQLLGLRAPRTLNPKPLNPKPLNPKPLHPKPLNPKPLNP